MIPSVGVRGAIASVSGQAVKLIVQFAGVAVLARLLSPSDFGRYVSVTAIVGVAGVLGDMGLSLAALQARSLSDAQKTMLFWWNSLIGMVVACVVFAAAPSIARFYGDGSLDGAAKLISLTFVLNGLTIQFRAEINRALRFKSLAVIDIVSQSLGVVGAIFLARCGFGFWSLVWQSVFIFGSSFILTAVFASWWPGLPVQGVRMRSLLRFGMATTLTQFVNYLSSNSDSVAIGRWLGKAELGVYSKAYQVFTLPAQQLLSPLTRVALPLLARVDDREEFERMLAKSQLAIAYVLVGCLACIGAFAPDIVQVLLGPKWTASAPVLTLLIPGGVFQAIGSIYYWTFLARSRVSVLFRCELVGRSVMIGLILLAAPHGIRAVAGAISCGLFCVWLVTTAFGLPAIGVRSRPLLGAAVRPLLMGISLVTVAMAVRVVLLDGPVPLSYRLAADCLVVCLVFGCWLVFSAKARDEVRSVAELVRRH